MRLRTLVSLSALLVSLSVCAQTSSWTIQVKGTVTENGKKLPGAVITVSVDNNVVNTINSSDGKFDFSLSGGNDYMISFTKGGYITKKISFNTKNVPDERTKHGFDPYTSISQVDIVPVLIGGNFESRLKQVLDQPIAKVKYDAGFNGGKGDFTYDEIYSSSMHDKVQKILDDYDAYNQQYKSLIKKADGEFKKQTYKDAKSDYTAALKVKPDDQYAKDMIAKCDDAMKSQPVKPKETQKQPEQKKVVPVQAKPQNKPETNKKIAVKKDTPAVVKQPVVVKPAPPPVKVTVCPCIMSRLTDSCRKYLKPFMYDDANTLRLPSKNFPQGKEVNFPGYSGQRFRIVINIAAMPPGTVVTVYDQDKTHKNRKAIYSMSDSENRIGFVDSPCKTGRFFVEYSIPPYSETMCGLVMFGYEPK